MKAKGYLSAVLLLAAWVCLAEAEFKCNQVKSAQKRREQKLEQIEKKKEAFTKQYFGAMLKLDEQYSKDLKNSLRYIRDEEEKKEVEKEIAKVNDRVDRLHEKLSPVKAGQHVKSFPKGLKMACMYDKYLVYFPKDYIRGKKVPLMLFLHGMGERGANLDQVRKNGPPKLVDKGQDFPFVIVSPQCSLKNVNGGNGWWNTQDVLKLLDYLEKEYNVDKKRIYLTGLSMGGFGTWAAACADPKRFAAVVPVCGGGNPNDASKLRKVPLWAFHGDADGTVNISKSKEMIDAIKKAGGDPKFTIYPGCGHNSWSKAYAEEELYEWLAKQKL